MRSERNAILYPDSETNATEYASLTYKQFNNITSHLAEKISQYIPPLSSDESVTFGILAMDGIKYILSQYALLKLPNVIMFPISPQNSPEAIEHLLKETKTVVLLTTSQFLPLIQLIQQKMNFQSLKIVLLDREEFQIEQLLKNKNVDVVSVRPKSKEELNKVVLILHR
jgi:acyl-CoA synthetase (AMP-forming)/AMP-acid ligase II